MEAKDCPGERVLPSIDVFVQPIFVSILYKEVVVDHISEKATQMLKMDSDAKMPSSVLLATLKLKTRTVEGSVPTRGLGSMHAVVPTMR